MNTVPAPAKTHGDVVERGRASAARRGLAKDNGYYRPPTLVAADGMEWDAAQRFVSCSAHTLSNIMEAVWSSVADCGKQKFNARRRRFEELIGRASEDAYAEGAKVRDKQTSNVHEPDADDGSESAPSNSDAATETDESENILIGEQSK